MKKGDFIKIIVDPDCESGNSFDIETTDKKATDLTYDEVIGTISAYVMPEDRNSLNWLRKKKVEDKEVRFITRSDLTSLGFTAIGYNLTDAWGYKFTLYNRTDGFDIKYYEFSCTIHYKDEVKDVNSYESLIKTLETMNRTKITDKFTTEDIEKVSGRPITEFWEGLDKTSLEAYNKISTVKEISHYSICELGFHRDSTTKTQSGSPISIYKRSDGAALKYYIYDKSCHVEYKNSSGIAYHCSGLLELLIKFKEYARKDEANVFGTSTSPGGGKEVMLLVDFSLISPGRVVSGEKASTIITHEEIIRQGFSQLAFEYYVYKNIGVLFFIGEDQIMIKNLITKKDLLTNKEDIKTIMKWIGEIQSIDKKREARRILKEEKAKEKKISWLSEYESKKWEEAQKAQKELEFVYLGYRPDGKFKEATLSELGWEPRNEAIDSLGKDKPRVYGYKSPDLQDVAILEDYGNVKKVMTKKELKYLDGIDCDVTTYQGLEDATRKIQNAINNRITPNRLETLKIERLVSKDAYSLYKVFARVEVLLKDYEAKIYIKDQHIFSFTSFKYLKEYVERVKEAREFNEDVSEATRILKELEYVWATPKDKKLEDIDFKMLGWDNSGLATRYNYKGLGTLSKGKGSYAFGLFPLSLYETLITLEDLVNLTNSLRTKRLQALKDNEARKS